MTTSRKDSGSESRSSLKQMRPEEDQEAHFLVIRWIWIRLGWTPIFWAQAWTSRWNALRNEDASMPDRFFAPGAALLRRDAGSFEGAAPCRKAPLARVMRRPA